MEVDTGTRIVTLCRGVWACLVDDGPGITDDRCENIFDPRAGDTHGGGLHLVETLVTSFGGDIYLADAANRAVLDTDLDGVHFIVELSRA